MAQLRMRREDENEKADGAADATPHRFELR